MTTASKLLDEARELHAQATDRDFDRKERLQALAEAVGRLIEAVAAIAEPQPPTQKAK